MGFTFRRKAKFIASYNGRIHCFLSVRLGFCHLLECMEEGHTGRLWRRCIHYWCDGSRSDNVADVGAVKRQLWTLLYFPSQNREV